MRVFIIIASLWALSSYSSPINYSIEIYLPDNSKIKSNGTVPGEFIVSKEDLSEMPFINDEGIELFDTVSYKITFSKEAADKVNKLKPSLARGIPFVLTVDREPILSGYFVNWLSSFGFGAYVLNTSERVQRLMKGLPEYQYNGLISEKRKNFMLIQALKRTGRLK